MACKATSGGMMRPRAVVEGGARCGRLDLEDLTATDTELRFFPPQARNDAIDVGNVPGTQSKHVGRAGDTLLLGTPVVLRQRRGPRQ